MKRNFFTLSTLLLPFIYILFSSVRLDAQPWIYDFGTGTGTYITTSGVNNNFLPQPIAGAGNEQLSVGTVALGSGFYLDNPGLGTVGSGSELRSTASTGTAANKFSIYGYSQTKVFHTRFTILFGNMLGQSGPKNGEWYFYQGKGSIYSNTANASNTTNQSFVSIRWTFGQEGIIKMAYHNGTSWIDLAATLGQNLSQAHVYTFDLYGNNTTAAADYYNNGTYTLAADRWDLWIDGVRITSLASGGIANNANIDSWLFAGEQSTTNYSSIFLDDILYSNSLPTAPLPIELLSFSAAAADNGVDLNWQTASEQDNDYFTIETSDNATDFSALTEIPGAGYSNSLLSYQYNDSRPISGTRYYRLKQTDYNGAFTYSKIISANQSSSGDALSISHIVASDQNISFLLNGSSGDFLAQVYSINGQLILSSQLYATDQNDAHNLQISLPAAGIYFLVLSNEQQKVTEKFIASF